MTLNPEHMDFLKTLGLIFGVILSGTGAFFGVKGIIVWIRSLIPYTKAEAEKEFAPIEHISACQTWQQSMKESINRIETTVLDVQRRQDTQHGEIIANNERQFDLMTQLINRRAGQ